MYLYTFCSDIDKDDTKRYIRIYLPVQRHRLKINALLHWQPTKRQKGQHNIDNLLKSKGQRNIDINEKMPLEKEETQTTMCSGPFSEKLITVGIL